MPLPAVTAHPEPPPSAPIRRGRVGTLAVALTLVALALPPATAQAAQQLALEPAAGPPGTSTAVSGRGFPANARVVISAGRQTLATPRASSRGTFELRKRIPSAGPGPLALTARANRASVTATFTVGPAPPVPNGMVASSTGARQRWSQAGTYPNRALNLRGAGFRPRRPLEVRVDGAKAASLRSDARGGVSARVPLRLGLVGRHGATVREDRLTLAFGFTLSAPPPNRPPSAALRASPSTPLTGEQVAFDASASSDPDGRIVAYAWDLDDDGEFDDGTGLTATRAFDSSGPRVARVRVTDDDGASAVGETTLAVGNRPPGAAFGATPASPLTGEDVSFDASGSSDPDGEIAAYAWDLDGDGEFDDASGAAVSRAFADSGPRTVSLRVTDDEGATAERSEAIDVGNRVPAAGFAVSPASPAAGEQVTFDAASSSDPDGEIAAYAWDLDGDGEFDDATGATASKAFDSPGEHPVRLRVTDDDGAAGSKDATITVAPRNEPPTAAFNTTPSSPLTGEETTLDASASSDPDGSIAAYAWDLDGDGEFDDAEGSSATTSFADSGSRTVRLRVTDDDGATAEQGEDLTVRNRPPSAELAVSPSSALTGEDVSFDASGSSDPDGEIASFAWDLDRDGEFDDADGPRATKKYASEGAHRVGVRVTDDDGDDDEYARTVEVKDPVIAAAGDIACEPPPDGSTYNFNNGLGRDKVCRQEWTARLIEQIDPDAALMLGDAQYETATESKLAASYDKSWGRFLSKTWATAGGSHDLYGGGAFYDYFGQRAGPTPYSSYSVDIGAWHVISLNSNCSNPNVGGCGPGSPSYEWLKRDLAENRDKCTLAFFHEPRWSSGKYTNETKVAPYVRALYDGGADVMLQGHDHDYERFAPQDPDGNADPDYGLESFVVGTGGKSVDGFATTPPPITATPNSEAFNRKTFGVLKMTLRSDGYAYDFVPDPEQSIPAGQSERFTDSGSRGCHDAPSSP